MLLVCTRCLKSLVLKILILPNIQLSKYPNIRTFYYAYVLLFTRFVAMFITRIRLRRKYNVYRCNIYFPVLNVSVQCEAENGIAMTSKRKRVVLTIEEKYIIIKDAESATKLARIHGGWFDGSRIWDPCWKRRQFCSFLSWIESNYPKILLSGHFCLAISSNTGVSYCKSNRKPYRITLVLKRKKKTRVQVDTHFYTALSTSRSKSRRNHFGQRRTPRLRSCLATTKVEGERNSGGDGEW